jgi:Zn-dependent protease
MSQQVQGGRALARFRVFGFPVHVDLSFLVIVALLGYYPGVSASDFVLWLLIAPLAVLVHELGHAVLARAAGAAPSIALAGFGGVTTYTLPRRVSRGRSIGISLAGPAVGLVIGGALLVYDRSVGVAAGTLAASAWSAAVFTTIGWSVLNLLPILPLDGGQALRELLPGDPPTRARRAAWVSVVVGAAVVLLALKASYVFGALLAGFLVVNNVLALRSPSEQAARPATPEAELSGLLWSGQVAEAKARLDALPADRPVDPAVRAAVLAAAGDTDAGEAALADQVAERPGDVNVAALALLVRVLRRDWDAVTAVLTGPRAADVPPALVVRAQEEAFHAGDFAVSARIGESATERVAEQSREVAGLLAYNTACGWAQAGELDLGMRAFERAARLGFGDLTQVDSDDDLAPLRGRPGYFEARDVVRRTALAAEGRQPPPAA